MDLAEALCILMFCAVMAVIMVGFPVAFSLAGTALGFAAVGVMFDVFEWRTMGGLASRIYGMMTNELLVAIPLFVFMGILLERSKCAEQLLETGARLFGKLSGGLVISVILIGGLLAAATGMVAATVATLALIGVPAMRRAGYKPELTVGTICASGTLAQLLPPSTNLIVIGDLLRGAVPPGQGMAPVTVTDLFAGAVFPGLLLVALFLGYVGTVAWIKPEYCPPVDGGDGRKVTSRELVEVLLAPLLLIVAVLGSILAGIATPTESSAVGAIGAILIAARQRGMDMALLKDVCISTGHLVTMVFTIMIGAAVFSLVFRGLGGEQVAYDILASIPGGATGALTVVLLLVFVLGFFLDSFEIIFIITPIFAPPLIMLGVDPLLFGVLFGVTLQTSYLTPPFGFAILYFKGVFPEVPAGVAYRGVMPYIALQIFALALIILLPQIALWLPNVLMEASR